MGTVHARLGGERPTRKALGSRLRAFLADTFGPPLSPEETRVFAYENRTAANRKPDNARRSNKRKNGSRQAAVGTTSSSSRTSSSPEPFSSPYPSSPCPILHWEAARGWPPAVPRREPPPLR